MWFGGEFQSKWLLLTLLLSYIVGSATLLQSLALLPGSSYSVTCHNDSADTLFHIAVNTEDNADPDKMARREGISRSKSQTDKLSDECDEYGQERCQTRAPGEDAANGTSEQQLLQQPVQRDEDVQPLKQEPSPDNMNRPRRSMSAPGVLANSSQLQTFMAGLVSDVEEYIGRGGYRALSDDLGESLLDDGENVSMGLSHAYMEPRRRGWGWLAGDGGRQDKRLDERWPPTMDQEDLRTADDLDAVLLSELSPRSLGDNLLVNGEPQQDLRLLRSRSFSSSQYGGNSVSRTVITFLKGMVGSYVLYLPRMFAEGGMLFSAAAVVVLGVASTYNMLLLLRCREMLARRGVLACTFGDVGYAALGRMGWICVDVSLFLSQLGYCVVYLIFVADNLGPLLRRAFSPNPPWLLGTVALTLAQVCLQVPLSWVRRLKYLGAGMLVANVCIFSGLVIILIEVAKKLAKDGVAGEDSGGGIILINPSDCLILLGAAVGLFEGIGLVLPIEDAMDLKVRDRLPAALSWAMAGLTVFLISVGALGYLAYGREVQHFITMDFPEESAVGATVRIAYSLGLIITSPLQLFPAVRVLEKLLWPAAANGAKKLIPDYRRKWLKNFLRSCLVGITALIALVAGDRFDSFIGIVGGVCAVPLALVYPPLFHLSLFGRTDSSKKEINLHRGLLVGGVFAGLSSTIVAIKALL